MKKIFLFFFLLGFIPALGQSISYPSGKEAEAITRGLGDSWLTVRVDFTDACAAGSNLQLLLGASGAPGEIEYIAGSLENLGGTVSIIQGAITNLTQPNFTLGAAGAGQFVEFRVKRQANGGAGQSAKDHVVISGACAASETDADVNSYNLLAPGLTMMPVANLANMNVGETRTRVIEVRQGGTGCMDELYLELNYTPGGLLSLEDLRMQGGASVMSYLDVVNSTTDKKVFRIPANAFDASGEFCNGESVIFEEDVKLTACGNPATSYKTAYIDHHDALYGHTLPVNSNITQSTVRPTLSVSMVNESREYCFNAALKYQTVRYTNATSGSAAANIKVTVARDPRFYLDYGQNWVIKDKDDNTIETIVPNNETAPKVTFGSGTIIPFYFDPGGCSLNSTAPNNITIDLGSLVLQPGEWVEIEVPTRSYNSTCLAVDECDTRTWGTMSASAAYTNSCGNTSYSVSGNNILNLGARPEALSVLTAPLVVNGGEAFEVGVFFNTLNLSYQSASEGDAYFYVDLAGTDFAYTGPATVDFAGHTLPVSWNPAAQMLEIGPIPKNATGTVTNYYGKELLLSLTATCGISGLQTIKTGVKYKYSNCQLVYLTMGCLEKAVELRCPAPGCAEGGATPVSFTLERNTFGLIDADNNGVADGTGSVDRNTPGIKLKYAVNGDDIIGTWNINVYPNTVTNTAFDYLYIDVPRGTTNFGLTDAGAPIEVVVNGSATTCTTAELLNSGATSGSYHYDISSCKPAGGWANGGTDQVTVKIPFKARATNNTGLGDYVVEPLVYSTYAPQNTPVTSLTSGTHYTCDRLPDYIRISNLILGTTFNIHTIAVCGSEISVRVSENLGMYTNNYMFPNEVRNFYLPNTAEVQFPAADGVTYRAGSAKLRVYKHVGGVQVTNVYDLTDGTHVAVSGGKLQFSNLSTFFEGHGGSASVPDEYTLIDLLFTLDPHCKLDDPTDWSAAWEFVGQGNGVNVPTGAGTWTIGTDNATTRYRYRGPIMSLSSPSLMTSADGNGSWTFTLSNNGSAGAPNSYFYIPTGSDWTNVVLKRNGNTINPNDDGYFVLGAVSNGVTQNIEISARYTGSDCTPELPVHLDFGCAVPSGAVNLGECHVSTLLPMEYYPAQIQLSVEEQPATDVDICTDQTVVYSINSALGGNVRGAEFRVVPVGYVITKGEIEYPAGSGNWEEVAATNEGGVLVYKVGDHSAVPATGLPGTIMTVSTADRSANLRLTYSLGCEFVSNATMKVDQRGYSACFGNVLGYDGYVRTNPIKLNGVGDGGSYTMNTSLSTPDVECEGEFDLTITATPVLENSEASDKLLVTLPTGIEYAGIAGSSPDFTFVSNTGGVLEFSIAAGIVTGTNRTLTLNLEATGDAVCGPNDIVVAITREFPPLWCGAEQCQNSSVGLLASETKSVVVKRSAVDIKNLTRQSGTYAPGNTVTYTLDIQNTSTLTLAADTPISFYCNGNLLGTYAIGTAVAGGTTGSFTFPVVIPATGTGSDCNGAEITASIDPEEGACLCDKAEDTIEDPLPVKLVSFTLGQSEGNVILRWETTTESNNSHFDVETSSDGKRFTHLGTVAGQGTTRAGGRYSYVHQSPPAGIAYYRLKQVDYDGRYEYFTIRSIDVQGDGAVFIYPNPASNHLVLSNLMPNTSYDVVDIQGRVVIRSRKVSGGQEILDISGLSQGMYVIRFNRNGQIEYRKLNISK